jgi:Tfp pilus assembly protein FimV
MSTTYATRPVATARPVPATRSTRPTRPAPVYRLTRRGRLAVVAATLLALAAIGLVFAAGSVATEQPEATETVVVAPGDTLWGIASDLVADGAVEGDVRDTMQHLVELNDLDSVSLAAGQRLQVPAS